MIKNRLFIKMVVIYFCIIISTLTMLGVLLSFLLNNYLVYNKQMEMLVKGSDITELVKPFLISKRNPAELIRLLNRADKNLGTEIWVIDSSGFVIAASADQKAYEGNFVAVRDIVEMQKNKVVIRQGYSQLHKETVLWVITPVYSAGHVIGGVIMYSPIIGITQTSLKVRNLFIYSAAVSIIFSTIIVYLLSKYVTGPLRDMGRVAKQLARGDFSERVKIKQQDEIGDLSESFNYMADQIQKNEKMRRDFVADVSHELRSPLTNIQGFIEAIMDGKDKTPEDRSRYLGILHKETMRLIRLVNELLDLSKLESGNPPTKIEPIDTVEAIWNSVAKMKPVTEEKGTTIIVDVPDEEIIVLGNGDRLEQVIINLIDNANRHSPPDGTVTITASRENDMVEIIVKDNGEGIPAEDLPLIWERFYKVDKSRCREKGGTGLGLAIAKKIIEGLGGLVKASSEEGKGSQIGFSIPIHYLHETR